MKISISFFILVFCQTILYAQSSKSIMYEGLGLEQIGDYKGALQKYNEAINLKPVGENAVMTYYYRGNVNRKRGRFHDAKMDYNKAVSIALKDKVSQPELLSKIYFDRALLNEKSYNYEDAIEDISKVIEYSSKDALSYAYRAFFKLQIKDKKGACLDFKEVKTLNSKILKEDKFERAYERTKSDCK